MNVLVDTSVWVGHFKQSNTELINLLMADRVICHELIIGELACGTPPNRESTLTDLSQLTKATKASHDETLHIIQAKHLFGKGCGYVDIALLASTLLTPNCRLWTLDKRLELLAIGLGVGFTQADS